MLRKLGIFFVAIAAGKIAYSLITGAEVTASIEIETDDE